MLDAEKVARKDEKPIVLERDRARCSNGVKQKGGERDQPGLQPVATHGTKQCGSLEHQRFDGAEPPQVKEAVVKKFHSAATIAPASPATQYALAFRYSHSAIATLINAPMPHAI